MQESDAQYPTGYTQTEGTDPTPVTAVASVNTPTDNDGYKPASTGTPVSIPTLSPLALAGLMLLLLGIGGLGVRYEAGSRSRTR